MDDDAEPQTIADWLDDLMDEKDVTARALSRLLAKLGEELVDGLQHQLESVEVARLGPGIEQHCLPPWF